MLNSIDEGVLEALWSPTKQDYVQILSRPSNSDIISINSFKDNEEIEISAYFTDRDSNGVLKLKKCLSSQILKEIDVLEAARYFR